MTCTRCGCDTPRRVCVECSRMEYAEEASRSGDLEDNSRAPTCAECGSEAPGGAYSDERPGVWLCPGCSSDDEPEDVSTEAAA